jgi:hypothetical protein
VAALEELERQIARDEDPEWKEFCDKLRKQYQGGAGPTAENRR